MENPFETSAELTKDIYAGRYYRVVPLDKQGKDMRASDVVKLATPECD